MSTVSEASPSSSDADKTISKGVDNCLPNGFGKDELNDADGERKNPSPLKKPDDSEKSKINKVEEKVPLKIQRRGSRRSSKPEISEESERISKSGSSSGSKESSSTEIANPSSENKISSDEDEKEEDSSKPVSSSKESSDSESLEESNSGSRVKGSSGESNENVEENIESSVNPKEMEAVESSSEASHDNEKENFSKSSEIKKSQRVSKESKRKDSVSKDVSSASDEPMDVDEEKDAFTGFDDSLINNSARTCSKFFEMTEMFVKKSDAGKSESQDLLNSASSIFNPVVKLEALPPKMVASLRKAASTKLAVVNKAELLKPFEHGWVRELVYRYSSDKSVKRNADVYYYTPSNKKVRSARDILEYLKEGDALTIDNFTFTKKPLGIGDPAKEIIREAKFSKAAIKDPESGPGSAKKAMPKGKGKPANSASSGSATDSPVGSSGPKSPSSQTTPKIAFKPLPGGKKNSRRNIMKVDKKRKSAGPDDDMLDETEEWSPETKPQDGSREVCSIECHLAMGLIPSLQCVACLCLYHPECVNLPQAKFRQIHSYVCKSCQMDNVKALKTTLPPPPPLTPITQTNPSKKDKDSSKIISRAAAPIVGAVTTWLPPAANVHVGGKGSASLPTASKSNLDSCPQSLISVAGKKYILVPNNNNTMTVTGREEGSVVANRAAPADVSNSSSVMLVPGSMSANGALPVQSSFQSNSTQLTNGVKKIVTSDSDSSPPEKMAKVSSKAKGASSQKDSSSESGTIMPPSPTSGNVMPRSNRNYWSDISGGYIALLHAFQYLKVHELLRAACVNKMWRDLASHRCFWEYVRMKNTRVRDWEGFGRTLRHYDTKTLDLRKMLLPETTEGITEMWKELTNALKDVPSLKKVDLGRCSPEAIEMLASTCPNLESIVTLTMRGQAVDAAWFKDMPNLKELKIKGVGTYGLENMHHIKNMPSLKILGLTTMKSLMGIQDILPVTLETLELGECCMVPEELATKTLPTLVNLRKLRLEKGQGSTCPTVQIITAIAPLKKLDHLELINFDIKPGFEKALAQCIHLRTLLIIPTYVTQSATTNHVVMGGVSKLASTLTYFVWGLTLELLRVTDLFIDQVEAQRTRSTGAKKGSGDSIPILKPLSEEASDPSKAGQTTSQVDILALPKLQKVLSTLLPTTKIKILKVPFSATWRQGLE